MCDSASFTALERLPDAEVQLRWERCRRLLERRTPEASGLLVFSRINIYYLTGTLGAGLFWLPREGSPVLLLRKGLERAVLESPTAEVRPFRSYREVAGLLAGAGSPLGDVVAAETAGLPWALADMLRERLPDVRFVSGDAALSRARAVKTAWELAKQTEAGERHRQGLREVLPLLVRPGMTERDIAVLCISAYLELGHGGLMRMNAPGEEVFFGHVAADDSGNYPHYYNGPMGFRGMHPALPCLGSETVWRPGTPLTVDMAFNFEGYGTDKTQTYWAGGPDSMPAEARRAYDLCVEVQRAAAASLRPGVVPSRIWRDVLDRVGDTPFAAGFMGLDGNQVPFLGHGIGLAIDEYPVIAKGFDEPLEAGMVLALEPKIGIPGFGMVGIENTFVVEESGGRSLTGDETDVIFLPGGGHKNRER